PQLARRPLRRRHGPLQNVSSAGSRSSFRGSRPSIIDAPQREEMWRQCGFHRCGWCFVFGPAERLGEEIFRVPEPGGTLLIIAESYRGSSSEVFYRPVMKLLRASSLSPDDQMELFAKAGYLEVEIFEERSKGWICAVGKKEEKPVQVNRE